MATLVLTTVGRVLGGPIGGLLGGLAGQAIDGRLFRGAAREGPRLTELAVQTSSYGTQIPKLFGTMRVAGTVIWSTDLIETRTTSRSGKGQPGTNSYNYSASFAVALSARRIVGVRRIWAEGKLLRGAAGDWKNRTGFRLHRGGEEQPVDPLIASATGATPAYRGIAYAVFEGMQLADYGNRIPSLTFEVEADAGPVASGAIAAALAGDVDGVGGAMLGGFAASGASVRGVLDTLTLMDGGWWQVDGARIVHRTDAGVPIAIRDDGMDAGYSGRRGRRTIAGVDTVAREVTVAHHDPARDYQIGVQRARRPGPGGGIDRVELPAVLAAGAAKAVAEALIARGEAGRVRRRVALGIADMGIAPGAIVAIAGEDGRWRVAGAQVEAMVTTLELVPLTSGPLAARATSGQMVAAADLMIGATMLVIAELPGLAEPLGGPRISVMANGAGAGWRQAALLYSLDDGASWTGAGTTAAPAVMGRIVVSPLATGATLTDRRSRMVVALHRADMMLADADATSLARGDNLALVGGELIQFARAEPLGGGRWALSDLRRGLRGTEHAIGVQAVGDAFVLIEREALAAIDLPASAIGRRIRVLASGVGDATGPVEAGVEVVGASVAPPSPVHLAVANAAGGGLRIEWTRRSRTGWSWSDGMDAPLAEETEAYRVSIDDAAGERGMFDVVGQSSLLIPAARSPAMPAMISVVQRGTLATSVAATFPLDHGA